MPSVRVVPLPSCLLPGELGGRAVAVFDVLRATTTVAAALAAGADEVRVFADVAAVRAAEHVVRAGERRCLPVAGFDLGNSPGDFTPARVGGRVVAMSTTNGTRAILAAGGAAELFAAALVNAAATAEALAATGRDVALLCAGTDGRLAAEDLCGAGHVAADLCRRGHELDGDAVALALAERDPIDVLRDSAGGRNVAAAGLSADIDFAARVDAVPVVCRVAGNIIRRDEEDEEAVALHPCGGGG